MNVIHRLPGSDGDWLELIVDPHVWVAEGPAASGLALAAGTRATRRPATAETAPCTCPADCERDHPNE